VQCGGLHVVDELGAADDGPGGSLGRRHRQLVVDDERGWRPAGWWRTRCASGGALTGSRKPGTLRPLPM
jgi:hypothetical protein